EHGNSFDLFPRCLFLLLQPEQKSLELSHRLRGVRYHKVQGLILGRLRKEPSIQLNLLAVGSLSEIQLVIDSPWPQQGRIKRFDSVCGHHEQNVFRRMKTI